MTRSTLSFNHGEVTRWPRPPSSLLSCGDRTPILATALVYAAFYAVFGCFSPFFPVWLKNHGLTETDIVVVLSAPMLLRITISHAIGRLADLRADRRPLVAALAVATLALSLLLRDASGFWPILWLSMLALLCWQMIGPIIDANAVSLVRRGIARDFGRIRLWGSISFGIVAVATSLLFARAGIDTVFTTYLVMLVGMVAATVLLPRGAPMEGPGQLVPFRLVARADLIRVFFGAAAILASQAMFTSIGSVHMLRLGYPQWSIGTLWTVAVVAEIAMFGLGPQALARFGPLGLLMAGGIVTAVRWAGMALDPPLAGAALLQLCHAATLSCTVLGLMAYIQTHVDDGAGARAQSAFATVAGLMSAGAILATGPLYQALGGMTYLVFAGMAALGLALLLTVRDKPMSPPA